MRHTLLSKHQLQSNPGLSHQINQCWRVGWALAQQKKQLFFRWGKGQTTPRLYYLMRQPCSLILLRFTKISRDFLYSVRYYPLESLMENSFYKTNHNMEEYKYEGRYYQ